MSNITKEKDAWILNPRVDEIISCKIVRETPDKYWIEIYNNNTDFVVDKKDVFDSKCKATIKLWYLKYKDYRTLENFISYFDEDILEDCIKEVPQHFI